METALALFEKHVPGVDTRSILELGKEEGFSYEAIRNLIKSFMSKDAKNYIQESAASKILREMDKWIYEKLHEVVTLPGRIGHHSEFFLEDLLDEISKEEPGEQKKLREQLAENVMRNLGVNTREKALEKTRIGLIPVPLFLEKFGKGIEDIEGPYTRSIGLLENQFDEHKLRFKHKGTEDKPEDELIKEIAKDWIKEIHSEGRPVAERLFPMYFGMVFRKLKSVIRAEIDRKIRTEGKTKQEIKDDYEREGYYWIAEPIIRNVDERREKLKERVRKMKLYEFRAYEKYRNEPEFKKTVGEYLDEILETSPNQITFVRAVMPFSDYRYIIKELIKEKGGVDYLPLFEDSSNFL